MFYLVELGLNYMNHVLFLYGDQYVLVQQIRHMGVTWVRVTTHKGKVIKARRRLNKRAPPRHLRIDGVTYHEY